MSGRFIYSNAFTKLSMCVIIRTNTSKHILNDTYLYRTYTIAQNVYNKQHMHMN